MCYIDDMREIVTDRPDFEEMAASEDIVYVDKTSYVQRMVMSSGRNYFISRPRRFGKSLMCSTLDALFSGKKELFKYLYIGGTDYDFKVYPVLRFDFSRLNLLSYETFLADFQTQVSYNASDNGISVPCSQPSSMMDMLLRRTDSPVIIIDEFDSPIIDAVSCNDHNLAERMRKDFNAFYKVIKSYTGKIRFLFITGCTKLSGLSIFSAMNNLNDISLDPDYAGMFGYTEEEIVSYFSEHIDRKLEDGRYTSREDFLTALSDYYEGYRFSDDSDERVYNPVSIGKYFSLRKTSFSNYWSMTGGLSTLAVTLARNNDLLAIVDDKPGLNIQDLAVFDIIMLSSDDVQKPSVLSLLYYAGYLTITGVDGDDVLLDFPNREVSSTFLTSLVRTYGNFDRSPASIANSAYKAVAKGNVEGIVKALNELYKPMTPMDLRGNKEVTIQLLSKALFVIAGVRVMTEVYAGKGRLDILVTTREHNYILELKVDGKSADDAMDQIIERHYDWLFTGDPKPLHLVGLDFRTDRRQIVAYTHMLYGSGEIERRDVPVERD